MKKKTFIVLLLSAIFIFSYSSMSAATSYDLSDGESTSIGGAAFSVSKKVHLVATTNTSTYDAHSWHEAGNVWYKTDQSSGVEKGGDCSGNSCGSNDPNSNSSSSSS